jgi:MFS family permease
VQVRAPIGRTLGSTAAATTACVFPAFLTGAMAVQLRDDLGFSASGTGLAVAAFFGAAAVSSVMLGRQSERIGPAAGLRLAAVGSGATQLAIAIAARSFTSLVLLLAVAGVANALAQPAANLLIARALPADRQGIAFAVKQSAIPLATLLAGAAVPAIALTVGWRWAFAGAAVLAGASAATVPARIGALPAGVRAPLERRSRDARLAFMTLVALGIGLGAASASTLGAFLVSAAVDSGLSEGGAGLVLTLGSAVGIAVRLTAGARADKRDGGHLRVVSMMLLAGAIAYCLLATGVPWVYVVATPLAFATGWAWPGLSNLAIVLANPTAPGAATGITQTGTYAGAVAGPLLFGVVADHASYGAAWLVAAGIALAAALAMSTARRISESTRS